MSKLYQYFSLIIIILFIAGCGGSSNVKTPDKQSAEQKLQTTAEQANNFEQMNSAEKIHYIEQLITSVDAKDSTQHSTGLSDALWACTRIISDYQQARLTRDRQLALFSTEQYHHVLQLNSDISNILLTEQLSYEQKNKYLLNSASLSLSTHQAKQLLVQLGQDFNSNLPQIWAMYHQLRAMALFQLDQQDKAVHELIIRHGYLTREQNKMTNQKLIWNYLATVAINEQQVTPQYSDSDRIYLGWLQLADILRASDDPQTLSHAVDFWLQNHPGHQADRHFIEQIIQIRQASILNLQQVAVLLPLQGKLAKPAKAILDGIIASHYKSPLTANIKLRFYDTSQGVSILTTYQQAIDDGAELIIGPLSKKNLTELSDSEQLARPTLALNRLNDKLQAPSNLYQFGLSPESAARMVAEKARMDGHYYAAIMAPDNSWGKRMSHAFSSHWLELGGKVADNIYYQTQAHDFSDTIKSLFNIDQSTTRSKQVSRTIGRKLEFTPRRRQDIDMIFMAAMPRQAKQIPLQIIYHHGETIPVYATAHIVANYQNSRQNIDMDGVKFADMPFLLGRADNLSSAQNNYQNTLYQRLFAMGVDSYQLAPYVNYLYQNPSESFTGNSGQIAINHDGHIIRSLPWATFKQGTIKLINPEISQENAALY